MVPPHQIWLSFHCTLRKIHDIIWSMHESQCYCPTVASLCMPFSLQDSYINMSSLQCIDKFLLPSWNLWWWLLCSKASLPSLDSLSYLMSLKDKAQVFQIVVLHKCSFDFLLLSLPLVMGSEQENHIEKNEIMPFAATWMGLEIIILSKSERHRYYVILLLCRIYKNDTNELIHKAETDAQT